MSAHTIARTVATEQGWADTTLLSLCETYVDNQSAPDAFTDYLRTVAETENEDAAPIYDRVGSGSAEDIIEAQGWTQETLLDLYLTYIDRQGADDAFEDHLRVTADTENGGRCPLCGGPLEGDFDMRWCAADCTESDTDDEDAEEYDAHADGCDNCGGDDHAADVCPDFKSKEEYDAHVASRRTGKTSQSHSPADPDDNRDDNRCAACRVPEHDICPLDPTCSCCRDTAERMSD